MDFRQYAPPREYVLGGRVYTPGRYLLFSSYDHASSAEHEIVYTYVRSPPFPPMGGENAKCFLRFFYCLSGTSPFQMFQVTTTAASSKQRRRQEFSRPLWSTNKEEDHVI